MLNTIEENDNHFEINIVKDFAVGDISAKFDVLIPSVALTKDNISKRCVMTLKEYLIFDTDEHFANDFNIGASGGFFLNIAGLGLKNNSISATGGGTLSGINSSEFLITNQTQKDLHAVNNVVAHMNFLTGNHNINEKKLCSNPFGNTLTIHSMLSDRSNIVFRAGQKLIIKFCIDFINPKIDQNFA